MAFHSKADFGILIGKPRNWVGQYIGRNKIVMSGDFIDDKDPTNAAFIKKWLANKEAAERKAKEKANSVQVPQPETPPAVEKTTKVKAKKGPNIVPPLSKEKLKAPNIQEPEKSNIKPNESDALELRKKKAEIAFKEAQANKTELQAAKLRGESIPTALVSGVVSTLGRSFQTNYKNSAESLLIEMSHKLKIPPELEAEFKGKLIEVINKAHADALVAAKSTIDSIVSEVAAFEANKKD